MAGRVEEEGIGLAGLVGEQEDAARRAHDRIDDGRIGDQNIARIGIELHDGRLVERQRDVLDARPSPERVETVISTRVGMRLRRWRRPEPPAPSTRQARL